MIAECIAIFAVVAQIGVSGCSCGQPSIILPTCESNSHSAPIFVATDSTRSSFGNSFIPGPLTKNIVAKGRYAVALRNCGPLSEQQIPVTTSHVTAPIQERPTVCLPASIPPPRTICHSCTCYKTILRPTIHDQCVTVPTIQRYVETGHKPVIENIQYEAIPVNCDRSGFSINSGLRLVEEGAGSSSGCIKLMRPSCGYQRIPMPQVQVVEFPRVQCIKVPEIQTVQMPQSVPVGCVPHC